MLHWKFTAPGTLASVIQQTNDCSGEGDSAAKA